MKVNFDIIDNRTLHHEGRHIDLHNNFNFIGFNYDVSDSIIKMSWIKSNGNRVGKNGPAILVLEHKAVSFFKVTDRGQESSYDDGSCLGELTFFPSASREINNSIIPNPSPNEGDDILYFFANEQYIRIHCEQIQLTAT